MKTLELLGVDVRLDKTPERSLTLENRDYPLSIGDKIGQRTKKTRRTFLDDMDSIAYGVEAWFEENSGYTRRVTEATVDIAQKLGVPENEIRRWVAYRLNCSTEKSRVVKSLLERLQAGSPADRG
jgi:hypothetical protein